MRSAEVFLLLFLCNIVLMQIKFRLAKKIIKSEICYEDYMEIKIKGKKSDLSFTLNEKNADHLLKFQKI